MIINENGEFPLSNRTQFIISVNKRKHEIIRKPMVLVGVSGEMEVHLASIP